MVTKLIPEVNKVYFINQYTLVHILSGTGGIQVDFNNYFDWDDKAIFLEKGQYIKFLSDDFVVRKIEFPNEEIFRNKEVRVLFKHLISLGYINFSECAACQQYLTDNIFTTETSQIIDISSRQWYWQNPFNANKSEYQVIFDLKEVIDEQFPNHLTNRELTALINDNGHNAQALVKNKIGLSVKTMLTRKRLMESKKEIAFTDKNIQEVAYELGYKDPAYFNRVFKKETGQNPAQFRKNFDYAERESFVQDLTALLKTFHAEERSLGFYADKLNLSVKTLEKKTREKMNLSLGRLIRMELVHSAKSMLAAGASIKEVSIRLGFEEPNHFSAFFKHHTDQTPTGFQQKKYNS